MSSRGSSVESKTTSDRRFPTGIFYFSLLQTPRVYPSDLETRLYFYSSSSAPSKVNSVPKV